jgi:hypothetical protein
MRKVSIDSTVFGTKIVKAYLMRFLLEIVTKRKYLFCYFGFISNNSFFFVLTFEGIY